MYSHLYSDKTDTRSTQRIFMCAGPMKIRLLTVYLLLLAGLLGQLAQAQSFPQLTGRVVDQAQLLDPASQAALIERLASHEALTSNQIVVATISSLEGFDIADYANRLGRAWQIGTAENDNGVLLVIAPNDRKVRIEVGYGLEGALTDALSSVIIEREILPAFRDNDYISGINNGVDAIIQAIAGEYTPAQGVAGDGNDGYEGTFENLIPLVFIAIVAVSQILRRSGLRKAAHSAFPSGFVGLFATLASGSLLIGIAIAVIVFIFMYKNTSERRRRSSGRRGGYMGPGGGFGGGFGGSGGGFGGGFGGGGGSFGGGGASGSW